MWFGGLLAHCADIQLGTLQLHYIQHFEYLIVLIF
jgi:hypothetical protein